MFLLSCNPPSRCLLRRRAFALSVHRVQCLCFETPCHGYGRNTARHFQKLQERPEIREPQGRLHPTLRSSPYRPSFTYISNISMRAPCSPLRVLLLQPTFNPCSVSIKSKPHPPRYLRKFCLLLYLGNSLLFFDICFSMAFSSCLLRFAALRRASLCVCV
jgi:hypothetical protein